MVENPYAVVVPKFTFELAGTFVPQLITADPAVIEPAEIPDTTGGLLLNTSTSTSADVALLPDASRALADKVCAPLLVKPVLHEMEYGAVKSSAPSATPSRRNCTPATPALSLALALTVTTPDTLPAEGAVITTVGDSVSGILFTVTITLVEVVILPAASLALAIKVWLPLAIKVVFHETVYGATRSS